jgi:hypothetical protein
MRLILKPGSLSDFRKRSENLAGRGQILPLLQGNSGFYYPKKRQNMHRPDGFAADSPKARLAACSVSTHSSGQGLS